MRGFVKNVAIACLLFALIVYPKNSAIPKCIDRVTPTVVYVQEEGVWSGSGVIVHENVVLTASHVVRNATNLSITLSNGNVRKAIGWVSDPNNDCALMFFDPREEFDDIAEFADSTEVGEQVLCIGSPFGKKLINTVTLGIISGIGRDISYFGMSSMITTDAASNPGNSGGPVFNMWGKMVGILVGTVRGSDGLGMIVSYNVCKRLLCAKPK